MMKKIVFPTYVSVTFFEESAILLDSRKNLYYTLNNSAADFYKLLKETELFEEAIKEFTDSYEGDSFLIEQDMKKLVGSLAETGLLEIKSSNS